MLAWLWTRLSDGGPQVTVSGRALRRFPDREVERLLRARVLSEQRKADSWSVCARCDCGLDARPIREIGGELRACCPHDAAEDITLAEDDLRSFGIDPGRLAAEIAATGALSGVTSRIADGLWLLGASPAGTAIVLCSDCSALDTPGAITAIRISVGPRPVCVVSFAPGPTAVLRLREAGVQIQPLTEVLVPGADGRDRLSIDLAPAVATTVRLILRKSLQAAILDGRPLDLPVQRFVLLRMLAEQLFRRDPVLLSQTIERELGRDPRGIARDLRASLVANGLGKTEAETLIGLVRGRGYRLGLEPAEVGLED